VLIAAQQAVTGAQWNWIILALIWVAMAFHTGLSMRRLGRRWWVWAVITLLASPVPAAIISFVDYRRALRRRRRQEPEPMEELPVQEEPPEQDESTLRRCRHCRAVLTGPLEQAGGKGVCLRCGMVIEQDYLA
jgi:hypothetical protein